MSALNYDKFKNGLGTDQTTYLRVLESTVLFLELADSPCGCFREGGLLGSDLGQYTSPYTNNTPRLVPTLYSIYSLAGAVPWAVAYELLPEFSFCTVTCLTYSFVLARCNKVENCLVS